MRSKLLMMLAVVATALVTFGQQGPSLLRSPLLNRGNRPPSAVPGRPGAANPAAGATMSAADISEQLSSIPRGTNGVRKLNFNQANVELVLAAYGDEVGKTIIQAPDVPKVTITLNSLENQELTKQEYLEAIQRALSLNDIVLSPQGDKFLLALSAATARQRGLPIIIDNKAAYPEKGDLVSQLFIFNYITAKEAEAAVSGIKSKICVPLILERINGILLTDTQENINRMAEVFKVLDVQNPVNEEVFTVQVKYAVAADIRKALETIVTESQKEAQKSSGDVKSSGSAGFTKAATTYSAPRLLSMNNRPGVQQPQTPDSIVAGLSDADRGMIRGKVLILDDERSNKLIIITAKTNMDFFQKVIDTLDVETETEVKVEVIRLKYAEAKDVSEMLNDLISGGSSSSSSRNSANKNSSRNQTQGGSRNLSTNTPQQPYRPSSAARAGAADSMKSGELTKENITVLPDERINGVVVMARTQDMPVLKSIIEAMDVKLSQVLIETVIIEVGLGDDINTGIDWVHGMAKKGKYYNQGLSGGGNPSSALSGSATNALSQIFPTDVTSLPAALGMGSGLNYYAYAKGLDMAAVIEASKTDSRSKYLASPIVMTVDNKEATIEATQMRYLLTGFQMSSTSYTSMAVPNYEQKEIGITIKVTPKINPNGTVMLTIEEEYSQIGEKQTIQTNAGTGSGSTTGLIDVQVPTTVTRKMSADISLENMQTVILGGMTQTTVSDSEAGIPILKDIPYIGKYLFGTTEHSESRNELLVFMTPYVLDDSKSAQFEAERRKKSLSDPRPWEDGGWSLSKLADPISKKEVMRRIQDEWNRQQEERERRLAIEASRIAHAEKMKKMTEKEREAYIKLNERSLKVQQELHDEEQNAQQEEYKKIIEEIKNDRRNKTSEKPAEAKAPDAELKAAEPAKPEVAVKAETK